MTQSASISSNLLSVTIKRWLSLFLCSVTANILIFSLSELKWLREAFSAYSKIITENIWVYHASAFIAGIAIKVLLDRFRVSHPKRMIGPNLLYPPLTISIFLTLGIHGYFSIYCRNNSAEIVIFMIEGKVFSQLYLVILGVCVAHLQHLTSIKKFDYSFTILFFITLLSTYISLGNKISLISYLGVFCYIAILLPAIAFEHYLIKFDFFRVELNKPPSESKLENDFNNWTLPELRNWFKDDKPIESLDGLEPDYRVYAKRIYERLINGGIETKQDLAQQIALCGPFGCGKSSIIASIVNELKQNTSEKTNKRNWLHCDISTWGIQADHVAQVVLIDVIDTIAEELDMCAFRSLPKHYVEAMKGGGSHWQIMAALLNKTTDVETCLAELNSVLSTTNINLLITIQDIDRGIPDDITRRLNELAALLDHLKNRTFNKVNFIIAMGNEGHDQANIISKVTDITEHILEINYQSIISKWHTLNFEEIFNQGLHLTEKPFINSIEEYNTGQGLSHATENTLLNINIMVSNQLIHSIRIMKKIMRRVDNCWTKEKLLGEVDLNTLLLTFTLRETEPDLFNALINIYPNLFYSPNALQKKASGEDTKIIVSDRIIETIKNITEKSNKSQIFYINCLGAILNVEELPKENDQTIQVNFKQYKATQTLRNQLDFTNYLNRLLLEDIPNNELRDQDVLKTFKAFEESTEEQKYTITEKILSDNRWLEAYLRFSHVMFNNENKFENQKIFFDLLIDASTEKPKLSDSLNQYWFKELCIELIKKDLFEYIIKNLAQSKIFRTLKMITYAVCSDSKLDKLISERSNLIKLTNQELIDSIFETEEIIIDMMNIYTSTADYNEKTTISSKLYFLLKIFINAQNEFQPQLHSLLINSFKDEINNVENTFTYGDVPIKKSELYKNTLLNFKNELINSEQKRWKFLIEIFSTKKPETIEGNHHNNHINFILDEMKKLDSPDLT